MTLNANVYINPAFNGDATWPNARGKLIVKDFQKIEEILV